MCKVKIGAEEQKASLVSGCWLDTKELPPTLILKKKKKKRPWVHKREKETKEQNGCLDTEEEVEMEEGGR